jgi:hypothetical protein
MKLLKFFVSVFIITSLTIATSQADVSGLVTRKIKEWGDNNWGARKFGAVFL